MYIMYIIYGYEHYKTKIVQISHIYTTEYSYMIDILTSLLLNKTVL